MGFVTVYVETGEAVGDTYAAHDAAATARTKAVRARAMRELGTTHAPTLSPVMLARVFGYAETELENSMDEYTDLTETREAYWVRLEELFMGLIALIREVGPELTA